MDRAPETLEDAREALFRMERRVRQMQRRLDRLEAVDEALRQALSQDATDEDGGATFLRVTAALAGMLQFDRAMALVARPDGGLACEVADDPALAGLRFRPGRLAAKVLAGRPVATTLGLLLDGGGPAAPGPGCAAIGAPFVQAGRPGFAVFLRCGAGEPFDREDLDTAAQVAVLVAQTLTLRAAAQASAARGRFLSSMSHELRTPLNGVLGMTDILERAGLPERARSPLTVIRRSASELAAVIESILGYAQAESGTLEMDVSSFDLVALARGVAARAAAEARAKGLSLTLVYESGLPTRVLGDAARTMQVMQALADNAVRHTPKGWVALRLSARERGERLWMRFEASDSGPGVDPASREAVFEPFNQGRHAEGLRPPGVGLGLSLARLAAQAAGGSISVAASAVGGAAFTFSAPLDTDAAAPPPPGPGALEGLGVALVDRDARTREAMADRLADWGALPTAFAAPPALPAVLSAMGGRGVALVERGVALPCRALWFVQADDRGLLSELPVLTLDAEAPLALAEPGVLSPFAARAETVAALRDAARPAPPAARRSRAAAAARD